MENEDYIPMFTGVFKVWFTITNIQQNEAKVNIYY